MKDPDDLSYLKFTKPSQRDKAIHTLEGILRGMWIDDHFCPKEATELDEWCQDHERLLRRVPFDEIVPLVRQSLEDGVMDPEEYEGIQWALSNSKIESPYFDSITHDIQELQGIIHGITADEKITKIELDRLYDWMLEREHLKGVFPYDELESLIVGTLRDGEIDANEHAALLAFFEDFVRYSLSKRVSDAIKRAREGDYDSPRATGICSVDPEIDFKGRTFVFTGVSEKVTRREIAEYLANKEAAMSESVSKAHYLVVGTGGSQAWAFSCYGRKVERAMAIRKKGGSIKIVSEVDFWDAN